MKTTKTQTTQDILFPQEKLNTTKPRSFRPMRSMVANRSFKPKTVAAAITVKAPEQVQTAN